MAAVLLLAAGCERGSPVRGNAVRNFAPETEIVASPPSTERTGIFVTFAWTGFDLDGDVVGYEWRISQNGPDGFVDREDTLEALLPWNFTTANDTTFLVTADLDSFAVDVDDPDLGPRDYRFWQSHTLFVRAVDDEGGKDPTPAHVSFTATTLAPVVEIDNPVYRPTNTCTSASRVLTFGWTGSDRDSADGRPEAVRWIFVPVGLTGEPCLTQTAFETGGLIRPDDPRWTEWIPYDAISDSGRVITLPRQQLGSSFLFAIQARDDAMAVTPTLEWGRNVRHVRVGNDKFPQLILDEPILGHREVVGVRNILNFEVVAGQPVQFRWEADGSSYAGIIEAYRFGVNLADPDDPFDPGWLVPWGNGKEWLSTAPLVFESGTPNLVIKCRDNSGTVTQVLIQIRVLSIGERSDQRDLLIVDDWPESASGSEEVFDLDWDQKWESIGRDLLLDFQSTDLIDAQDDVRLGFELVNRYKSVIWFVNSNDATFIRRNLMGSSSFNWLEVYQQRVGNLMLVGPGAGIVITPARGWLYPVVFDVSSVGSLGLGTTIDSNGRVINRGTLEYPYRAFCLEAVDFVRPALQAIFGEAGGPGNRLRMGECDGISRAVPTDELFAAYPEAIGEVTELRPKFVRTQRQIEYRFDFEEFYDWNATSRRVTITPRECQVPMFEMVARRDDGLVENPRLECEPRSRDESRLTGAPVAVISRTYSDTKQLRGSEDAIWGFHPIAFDQVDVEAALHWLMESRWELEMRR